MPVQRSCDHIVFDLGDLFPRSPDGGEMCPIPPHTLQRMFRSLPYFDHEKDEIDEDDCYALLASQYRVPVAHVASAMRGVQARRTLNEPLLALVRQIRSSTDVRAHGIFNISAPDWTRIRDTTADDILPHFDNILTSSDTRERMPSLVFYRHFLDVTGIDPRRTAFVSSRLEAVVSAMSLGMEGIMYASIEELARKLRSVVRDPVADGVKYLSENAGKIWSTTSTGVELHENFAQLLMLEVTGDPTLVDVPKPERLMKFFRGEGVLTTADFPPDVDTTSIACTVLRHSYPRAVKNDVMDEMLTLRNEDGIVLTYFDTSRPRIDPVVCVNALTFFHANGRGPELRQTLAWVLSVLEHRAYAHGTLYYHGADPFLYFLARLLGVCRAAARALRAELLPLFRARVAERFGEPGDALMLAMRLLAAAEAGLEGHRADLARLVGMQEPDGSWPVGWMYKYGASGVLVGNKGLTTAMAVAAIRKFREQ
ncbi:hypothetical protein BD413DRAFT_472576 [Trametes elegans]|nr:hypothetical protein BD413DRAFT_472576 [Trametes elegans]